MSTIDSFRIDVPADELKTHFETRLGHHTKALEELANNRIQLVGAKGSTSDIVKKHKSQVKLLTYIVNHMPAGETYRLSLHELDGLMVLQELVEE